MQYTRSRGEVSWAVTLLWRATVTCVLRAQSAGPQDDRRNEILLAGACGGGLWRRLVGGSGDGVGAQDQFGAAILLAAFGGVIGGDGLGLAEAAGLDGIVG